VSSRLRSNTATTLTVLALMPFMQRSRTALSYCHRSSISARITASGHGSARGPERCPRLDNEYISRKETLVIYKKGTSSVEGNSNDTPEFRDSRTVLRLSKTVMITKMGGQLTVNHVLFLVLPPSSPEPCRDQDEWNPLDRVLQPMSDSIP
jgi:hypothetical protein